MPKWATRLAIWGPLLVAGALLVAYLLVHRPFASDSTELVQVPLSEADPALDRVGGLKYLGGLDIPRMGQNIGGLSGLRWDEASGRLLAITDDARWVWITPIEDGNQLTGIAELEVGDLLGLEGEKLTGKEQGDSESLTRVDGGWLVGFERFHRVWLYRDLTKKPTTTGILPIFNPGSLSDNAGLEAMATAGDSWIGCAQRAPVKIFENCVRLPIEGNAIKEITTEFRPGNWPEYFAALPPDKLIELGGVPTDADALAEGTLVILFRSWSRTDSNRAAIVTYSPTDQRTEIATLEPPLTVDNFEGIAVREKEGRTFLYIVSDDNFSSNQRTLLMKFEVVVPDGEAASPTANTPPSSTP